MKTFTSILSFVLFVLLIPACSTRPTPVTLHFDNPYAPQPGDRNLMVGDLKIESSSVSLVDSQVMVNFAYRPPTPCYHLRVEVMGPNAQNQINLKAYGVAEKNKACTLMPLATPLQASLNLGSAPRGQYTVFLNGNQIGAFSS